MTIGRGANLADSLFTTRCTGAQHLSGEARQRRMRDQRCRLRDQPVEPLEVERAKQGRCAPYTLGEHIESVANSMSVAHVLHLWPEPLRPQLLAWAAEGYEVQVGTSAVHAFDDCRHLGFVDKHMLVSGDGDSPIQTPQNLRGGGVYGIAAAEQEYPVATDRGALADRRYELGTRHTRDRLEVRESHRKHYADAVGDRQAGVVQFPAQERIALRLDHFLGIDRQDGARGHRSGLGNRDSRISGGSA